MKKIAIILLSASMFSNIALASPDPVLATYKGGEVKESQVMDKFKNIIEMQPENKGKNFKDLDSNLQEALVKGFVNSQLLEQEAKKSGIDSSPEFQKKLETLKSQILENELIQRHVKSVITDAMVDEEYNKLVENLKKENEVKVSHILVDSEEKAKEIKKKISKGKKFADLAKEFSKDDASKIKGGELGYVTKGQLVPEFENKALSMKVNEVSDPVKTQFGWHIIKVFDKRPVKIPSKEEARGSIANNLSREAIEKYISELASKADIKLSLPQAQKNVEQK